MSNIFGYTTINESYTSKSLSGLELAKQDLMNHFKIRKGEKWSDDINQEVYSVVSYDPRFKINDTNVRVVQDTHSVTVSVKLTYLPTTTATELQIKFDREFLENAEF